MHVQEHQPVKIVRPDKEGRITLGKLTQGIDSYQVFETENHQIILKPFIDMPLEQAWLFQNHEDLASVLKGAAEIEAGKGKPFKTDEL